MLFRSTLSRRLPLKVLKTSTTTIKSKSAAGIAAELAADIAHWQAQRIIRRLQRQFANECASLLSLRYPAVPSFYRPAIALWKTKAGWAGYLGIDVYSWGCDRPGSPPWTLRISCCVVDWGASKREQSLLCLPKPKERGPKPDRVYGLELTILPQELGAFTNWACDRVASIDHGRGIEQPPFPLDSQDLNHSYLWSAAAATAYDKFREWRKSLESRKGG